jgi:hypothetical protein
MSELRDAIYYLQLARVARMKADATDDADLARRLREAAVRNERKARKLNAAQSGRPGTTNGTPTPETE